MAKIHKQPCSVVYTDYRPTPLQHFIFPAGGDGVFLVVDEKGKFRDDNFQKAMALLGQSGEDADAAASVAGGGGKKRKGGPGMLLSLASLCSWTIVSQLLML